MENFTPKTSYNLYGSHTIALAALAILGHRSAHSFPMGPVIAEPAIKGNNVVILPSTSAISYSKREIGAGFYRLKHIQVHHEEYYQGFMKDHQLVYQINLQSTILPKDIIH